MAEVLGVFAPHPDDAEIFSGGVVALYRQAGWRVVIVTVTSGNRGHLKTPPAELAEVRRKEAERSAALAKAELIWLGWEDTEIKSDVSHRNEIVETLRQTRANLVIGPSHNDYHPDHRALGELLVNASYLVGVPQLKTGSEACPPPQLWFYETHGGVGFQPEHWVNVSSVYPLKRKMLEAHQSQVEFLREHDGFDLLEYTETKDRWHGFQCRCRYAEVFCLHRVFPVLAAPDPQTY
jgi:LmbE family N-acetylglucosaminyl deacetylase